MKADIRIGTSGWYYDHWIGSFYPSGLPKNKWISFYQETFDTVEINATFYRHFPDSTFLNWAGKTNEDFLFVFKAPRIITHRKYLKNCQKDIRDFERQCLLIQEHYGMILLQLPPALHYDPDLLKQTLAFFTHPEQIAVEFRHSSWFNRDTAAVLEDYNACLCNVDSPALHEMQWVTGENAYIRLHGRSQWYQHNYTEEELHEIADRVHTFEERGAKRIYIFFNNDFGGYAPANALTLKQML